MALSKPSILMFVLTTNPFKGALSLRPVCKSTDRNLVRELFRREFYDDLPQVYSDQGLWEIYDSMDTSGVLGAYLVTWLPQWLGFIGLYQNLFFGLILVVVMLFFPDGLLGAARLGISSVRRRQIAGREQIPTGKQMAT